MTDHRTGVTTDYSYDELNRLDTVDASGSGDDFDYDYDPAGNIAKRVKNGATTSFRYNAASQLCWQLSGTSSNGCSSAPSGATSYSYDQAGNLTGSSAGLSASFNGLSQLTSFSPPGGSASSYTHAGPNQWERDSGFGWTFTNNVTGVGVRKSTTETFYYRHDDQGRLHSQRLPNGNIDYYVWTAPVLVDSDGLVDHGRQSPCEADAALIVVRGSGRRSSPPVGSSRG